MQTRLFAINEWNENGIENNEVKIALLKVYNASTIYLRFDAFISLISACDRHTDEADLPYIQLLRAQALQFALAIVDAKNDEELATKIASRNKYKHIDSEYMPWHVPTTRTDITKSATRKEYVRNTVSNAFKNVRHKKYSFVSAAKSKFDEEENVRYFSAAERENHRIFPSNGLLMKISTQMKDDFSSLVLHRFDTSEEKTFDEKGSAIYVVSPKGDIFAGTTIPRVIQHSSFLAGMATIASGSLNATEGHYKKADDFSGHYMPQFQQAIQAITFFRKARLLISPTIYESFDENTFSMKTFQVHSAPMSKK